MRLLTLIVLWSCCCWLGLSAQCVLDPVTDNWQGPGGGPCANSIVTAVPFLLIAPDARGAGLADMGTATSADAFSMHYNTAKLITSNRRFELAAAYSPWVQARLGLNSTYNLVFSGYMRLGEQQVIGLSSQFFSLGPITRFDSLRRELTGSTAERSLTLGYARAISSRFSVGINIKSIYSDLGPFATGSSIEVSPGKSYAFDFSGHYHQEVGEGNELAIGLTLSNIGSKISYTDIIDEYLPANFRLGMGYVKNYSEQKHWRFIAEINKLMVPTPQHEFIDSRPQNGINDYREQSVVGSILRSWSDAPDGFSEELRELQWALGTEFNSNRISGRFGWYHQHKLKSNVRFFSLGLGYQLHRLQVDLSYLFSLGSTSQNSSLIDRIYRVSLTYQGSSLKP